MAPNQYGGQSNTADIMKTSNISHIEQIISTNGRQSTGQYTHKYQGENTDKTHLIYKSWFTENSKTIKRRKLQ